MLYPGILNQNQLDVVNRLDFGIKSRIYLAGGTALALYLNHRTSVDLDFYSEEEIDNNEVLIKLQKIFNNLTVKLHQKRTLFLTINEVDFSLFYYPYKLIRKTEKYKKIEIASIEDVLAMKVGALVQRGKRRDFIDLYYLLQKFSLEEILKLTLKKFPGYQEMLVLRALIFFEDAEDEDLQRGIRIFDKNFSWKMAKEKIFDEVRKYQLSMINKPHL